MLYRCNAVQCNLNILYICTKSIVQNFLIIQLAWAQNIEIQRNHKPSKSDENVKGGREEGTFVRKNWMGYLFCVYLQASVILLYHQSVNDRGFNTVCDVHSNRETQWLHFVKSYLFLRSSADYYLMKVCSLFQCISFTCPQNGYQFWIFQEKYTTPLFTVMFTIRKVVYQKFIVYKSKILQCYLEISFYLGGQGGDAQIA